MTSTITLLPIIAALFTANNFENIKDVRWGTANAEQKTFVENYWPNRTDLDLLKDKEMQSKASRDVTVINQFLKDNKFSIQLTDLKNPLAFYVASILKVALEWKEEGTKTTLEVDANKYPAVKFDKSEQPFTVFKDQILEIEAKNGDLVYMMVASKGEQPLTSFSLVDKIMNEWQKNITPANETYYNKALFPMVDIDQKVDIRWLVGISGMSSNFPDDKTLPYTVAQALQQTKFQMNEKGAKVESAVAIACLEGCRLIPEVFTIDDSFYLWIMRPGMKMPIFAAYIDKDAWKAPKE